MIENFVDWIPRIGKRTQQKLRKEGFLNHEHYLTKINQPPHSISYSMFRKIQQSINLLNHSLNYQNRDWIINNVPNSFHWMLIPYFIDNIAYIDIETTGLRMEKCHITTVAVYDGKSIKDFVFGDNLQELPAYLDRYPAIATYNGKCFDIPFMKYIFKRDFKNIHFDLRFLLAKVGQRGGLKAIENRLNINRDIMGNLDGYSAVLLWKKFRQTHEKKYLNTLLAYNNADVFSLEYLLAYSYNRRAKATKLPYKKLKMQMVDPSKFDIPIADEKTVKEILRIRQIMSY